MFPTSETRMKTSTSTTTGMDKWVYDNAMHSIAWIVQELCEHHEHITLEELWYEEMDQQDLTIMLPIPRHCFKWSTFARLVPPIFETAMIQTTATSYKPYTRGFRKNVVHNAFRGQDNDGDEPLLFQKMTKKSQTPRQQLLHTLPQ